MQQSLHEVYVRWETKSDELLTYFFRREVALLVGVPRFEDQLSEVHVVTLLNQAHARILMDVDPLLNILSNQELLIIHTD